MNRHNLVAATLILSALAVAPLGRAASLVNINTADSTTLQSLNGIGPSKAQAIIDYRTQHGPFATIADIQNVSGIGPTTYANIKDFITVGDSGQAQPQPVSVQAEASSTVSAQLQTQTSGGASPPPISAQITTDALAIVGAGTLFTSAALSAQGEPLGNARFLWNFGDGATAEGAKVWHTYAYPGTYAVVLSVANGFSSATARATISASPASVALLSEGDGSLTVANHSDYDLDIGLWSVSEGTSTFIIPEGTTLLRGKGVRFSPLVLKFSGDERAVLYYQNGTLAAQAGVSASSPLRGEVVDLAPTKPAPAAAPTVKKTTSPAPSKSTSATTSLVKGTDQAAAAGLAPFGVEWSYLLGLVAIIAIGAVGTYYAHPAVSKREETFDPADEFEIED